MAMRSGDPLMLITLIEQLVRHRLAVALAVLSALVATFMVLPGAPLDALPDSADPQVVVEIEWPRDAERIDAEVVAPLARAFLSIEGVRAVRASSHLGLAFLYVVLERAGERQAVRRQVADRLAALRPRLPADARVTLGPDAGAMGWIYQYALVDRLGRHDLRQLRRLNLETVIPALERVAGVAEVANVGGLERQLVVRLYPPLLAAHGVTLEQVIETLRGATAASGGRAVELTGRDYQLRAAVAGNDPDALEALVVARGPGGEVVRLGDLGYFQVDFDLRRGIAELDGRGEVVGGIVVMAQGGNALALRARLERALDELAPRLPEGVALVTAYDRADLIERTLSHFARTLGWELAVVAAVVLLALGSLRAAVAPLVVTGLGVLYTLLALAALGQTINLLSLAGLAIAIGVMADAALVVVENSAVELARHPGLDRAERRRRVIASCAAMMRPLLYALAIIVISFLPLFFLGEREGRIFDPLAYGKTAAMALATLLTLVVLPPLLVWAFDRATVRPPGRRLPALYRGLLERLLDHRAAVVAVAVAALLAATWQMSRFERAYMPELDEGALLYMPTTVPGLPLREAGWVLQAIDARIAAFPEVERVFGKLGRAESATDPAPVTMIETTIVLRPRHQWRSGMTEEKLRRALDEALRIPGYVNTWTRPIAARAMMQESGIQTAVGLKILGSDGETIERIARHAEALLAKMPGVASALAERIAAGDYLDIRLDPARLAEHGVTVAEAMATVHHALGAAPVATLEGAPLALRYAPEYIDTLDKVRRLPVVTADGRAVALEEVAGVAIRRVPEMVRNEGGERAGYLFVDLDGISATDFLARARPHLAAHLDLPPGYRLVWSGTALHTERAAPALAGAVAAALALIALLLLAAFRCPRRALLVLLAAPFSLVGGVALQALLGFPLTTAVVVGYLAVAGVAVQTGILMVEFIDRARAAGHAPRRAILEGAAARLRPKLMTVATTVLGLLPVVIAGGELGRPIAAPIVGGMIGSALYALLVIPVLHGASTLSKGQQRLNG